MVVGRWRRSVVIFFIVVTVVLFAYWKRFGSGDALACQPARAGQKFVLIAIGTRPEAIKVASVYHELSKQPSKFRVEVWVSGQHPDMIASFIETFHISVSRTLYVMQKGQSLGALTSRAVQQFTTQLSQCQPDIMLVQGDTTTAYAAAVAAFYLGVPVGHIEAGLRTYRLQAPFPEEFNRQSIGLIASYHFVPTAVARDNLVREGVDEDSIFVTGNPVIDACFWAQKHQHEGSRVVRSLRLPPDARAVLLTAHRRENQVAGGMRRIFGAAKRLLEAFPELHIVFPVHPNPAVREAVVAERLAQVPRMHLLPPLPYLDNVELISRSHLILTDSGGLQEEASAFHVPVLVMRDASERMEGVYAGVARLISSDGDAIVHQVSRLLQNEALYRSMSRPNVFPYGDGTAGQHIADILSRASPGAPKPRYQDQFKQDAAKWIRHFAKP